MPAPTRRLRRSSLALGVLSVALAVGTVVATSVGLDDSGADGAAGYRMRSDAASSAPAGGTVTGRSVGGQAVPVEQAPVRRTAPPSSAAPTAPADPAPIWADDFDGAAGSAPATSNWQASTGGNGFGNQELECNTDSRDNSALDGDGHLVITALYDPGHQCADGATTEFTSARLSTANLQTMQYGKLRVRAQLPSASGLWPGIWALGADHATVGWPQSGEVDIAESVGKSPDTIYQTLHGPSYSGGPYSLGTEYSIGRPTSSGFHTYGVDWSPDRIVFSVDGDAYASFSRADVEKQGTWVFDQPFYLLLDVAVGGTFPGPPDDTSVFPQQMLVDFIRVYA